MNEVMHYKWNPFNLVNAHYMRNANQVFDLMLKADIPKNIYRSNPNIVLNIGNEYFTFMMMNEFKKYYKNSPLTMP
jgi:hypothetical protein